MIEVVLGVGLIFFGANDVFEKEPFEEQAIVYEETLKGDYLFNSEVYTTTTLQDIKYKDLTRQQYDYSCGSAALTTLFNEYLGKDYTEVMVMDGLMMTGDKERIIRERNFSFLDMKRLSNGLGFASGGYKGSYKDLTELDKPAIVPIEYAGFRHFVVIKTIIDGRVYVADPSAGNISFTEKRFREIWGNKIVREDGTEDNVGVLFMVFPSDENPSIRDGFEMDATSLAMIEDNTMTFLALERYDRYVVAHEQERDEVLSRQELNFDVDDDGFVGDKSDEFSQRAYYRNR